MPAIRRDDRRIKSCRVSGDFCGRAAQRAIPGIEPDALDIPVSVRILHAIRFTLRATEGHAMLAAPVVTCSAAPVGRPLHWSTRIRQMLMAPLRLVLK